MDAVPVEKSRSFIPLIITIIGLTIGAGLLIARMERKAVMNDWANRRCELPIMFAGALYKPPNDPRTPGEFSSDNFSFCLKQMQKTAIGAVMAAPLKLFDKQVQAANTVAESQNSDKRGMANFVKEIGKQILEDFYNKLTVFSEQFSRILQRFKMAYNRIAGITTALAMAGLSMVQAIFNGYNTVILVVIIILSIIAALFIIMFFVLFPLTPILMSAVAALTAAGFGAAVGGFASVFCFSESTPIAMADGSTKPAGTLQLGDVLDGSGVVEGLYEMNGVGTQMYQLGDAIVSGDHLVWLDAQNKYVSVSDHPSAVAIQTVCNRVYCPIISNRSIRVGSIWFRDWEEIEESSEADWNAFVGNMLGSTAPYPTVDAFNGFGVSCNVCTIERGWISIKDVTIGNNILTYDANNNMTYTPVLGTLIQNGAVSSTDIGNDVWVYSNEQDNWIHPAEQAGNAALLYNLVTQTGTFLVEKNGLNFVRDALEVGVSRISETYSFVLAELVKTDSHPPNR